MVRCLTTLPQMIWTALTGSSLFYDELQSKGVEIVSGSEYPFC